MYECDITIPTTKSPINLYQLAVLTHVVSIQPRVVSFKELRYEINTLSPRLSRALFYLADIGYVKKNYNLADRRTFTIVATKVGHDLINGMSDLLT